MTIFLEILTIHFTVEGAFYLFLPFWKATTFKISLKKCWLNKIDIGYTILLQNQLFFIDFELNKKWCRNEKND